MTQLPFCVVIGLMLSTWLTTVWILQSMMSSRGRAHWIIRSFGWIGLFSVGCGFIAPDLDSRPFGMVIRLFDWFWGGAYHTAMFAILISGVLLWISSAVLLWRASRSSSADEEPCQNRVLGRRRCGQGALVTSVVTVALFLTQWMLATRELRATVKQTHAAITQESGVARMRSVGDESVQKLLAVVRGWQWPDWDIHDLDMAITDVPIPSTVEEFLRAHADEMQALETSIDDSHPFSIDNEDTGKQLSLIVRVLAWRARWQATQGRSEDAWSNWHRMGRLAIAPTAGEGMGMVFALMACRHEQIRTLEWLIAAGIEVPQDVETALIPLAIGSSRLKLAVDRTMSEMLAVGCRAWLGEPTEEDPPWGGFHRGWPPRCALPLLAADDLQGWQRFRTSINAIVEKPSGRAAAVDLLRQRIMVDRMAFPLGREYSGHLVLGPGSYVLEFLDRCLEAQAGWEIARLGIVVDRHRREMGRFFSEPRELRPDSRNQLGIDLFTGSALKFVKPNDKTVLIYSVGANRQDDGGDFHEAFGITAADVVFRVRTP